MVTIQTERLVLRPFQTGDGPAFYETMSDPQVARYTAASPLSLDEAQNIVKQLAAAQVQALPDTPPSAFVITLKESGKVIGNCRLGREKENPKMGDVAYFLNRRYWGKGYATEAVRALLNYGFARFDVNSIFAICVPENVASRRVMEKAGMTQSEPLTLYAANGNWYQGAFRDVTYLRYVMVRPEC